MARGDRENEELLTNKESIGTPGEVSESRGAGKSRDKSVKENESLTKGTKRKKSDALEGRGSKQGTSSREDSDSTSRGKGGAADEKGGKGGSGTMTQNLQSGQTTVQFSSGGGAGNLGSLLALFASSANLAKADVGSGFNIANINTNLSLRAIYQVNNAGSLLGAGKEAKELVAPMGSLKIEIPTTKFINIDVGTASSKSANSFGDLHSALFSKFSDTGSSSSGGQESGSGVTLLTNVVQGSLLITPFNSGGAFFPPNIIFTFPNSATAYTGVVTSYFNAVSGLTAGSRYTYQLLSPQLGIPDTQGQNTQGNNNRTPYSFLETKVGVGSFTVSQDSALSTTLIHALRFGDTEYSGLSITRSGDVQVFNITKPTSILVSATPIGSNASNTLVFRIDAGPGPLVTSGQNNIILGQGYSNNTGNVPTTGTVIRAAGEEKIAPDGVNVTITRIEYTGSAPPMYQNIYSYTDAVNTTRVLPLSIASIIQIPLDYILPSNTVYRHTGTIAPLSLATASTTAVVPDAPAYGNFEVGTIQYPSDFNIRMGGNVLDVYGTSYGSGGTLSLVGLPIPPLGGTFFSTQLTGQPTLTFGNNILGGFGTQYGDFKTLAIQGAGADGPILNFQANNLNIDKAVGSTLYPHIETLSITGNIQTMSATFQDSVISGNVGPDIFYGQIPIIGDLGLPNLYRGFIQGVNVSTVVNEYGASQVQISTPGTLNVITWANDIYVGGYQPTLLNSVNALNGNVYHFTLLGDTNTRPVNQGNALIVDFHKEFDTLDLQLTPALFRALSGADGQGYDKSISRGDLDTAVQFSQPSQASLENLDPYFRQYIEQYESLRDTAFRYINSTTITFAGGGSITLGDIFGTGLVGTISSFADLANVVTEVNLTYIPIAAIDPTTVAATTIPIDPTPQLGAPFVYGNSPNYIYELDKFFDNSLFATYQVAGVPADVSIDTWGTIRANNATPALSYLTITATDQQGGTATPGPLLFGFLDAPITYGDAGVETVGQANSALRSILVGGDNSILVGHGDNLTIGITAGTLSGGTTNIASTLIVDSAPSATAYGDYKTINLTAAGGSGYSFYAPHTTIQGQNTVFVPGSPTSISGVVSNYTLNIGENAFYIHGTTYGVADKLLLNAYGGTNTSVNLSYVSTTGQNYNLAAPNASTISFYDSAVLTNSQINIAPRTLMGSGMLFGGVNEIDFNAMSGLVGGTNGFTFTRNAQNYSVTGTSAILDTSASVVGNTITFHPATLTVIGDVAGQTSTLVSGALTLDIQFVGYDVPRYYSGQVIAQTRGATTPAPPPPTPPPPLNYAAVTSIATIGNNHLVFEGGTLTGGLGNTEFYGNLKTLGDANRSFGYPGFVSGVTVSTVGGVVTITTGTIQTSSTLFYNNSITYANNTYIGGAGWNHYNSTLIPDTGFRVIGQGFQTITNFNPVKDTLVFNVEVNLFNNMGMNTVSGNLAALAAKLDRDVTVSLDGAGGSLITFAGGGGINLQGVTGFSSLAQLVNNNLGFTPIIIQAIGTPYQPITFNPGGLTNYVPVYVNGTYLSLFQALAPNTSPLLLKYSIPGVTGTPNAGNPILLDYAIAPGISLTSNGALSVEMTTGIPLKTSFFLTVSDGTSSFTTPTALPLFALNTTTGALISNTSNLPLSAGSTNTEAFYSTTANDAILGGGEDIQFIPTSAQTVTAYGAKLIYDVGAGAHTIHGDIQNIFFDTTTGTGNGATGQVLTFGPNLIYTTTGNIYANVQNIIFDGSGITGNSFTFANDQLFGTTAGTTSYFGHVHNFGTTTNTSIDVVGGFYRGVVVTTNVVGGQNVMTITDANNNSITWGNVTYSPYLAAMNRFNFTLVQTNDPTPRVVMQGFDTISFFNPGFDRFVFNVPYRMATSLATAISPNQQLDFNALMPQLTLAGQLLTFSGGGSITIGNAPFGAVPSLAQVSIFNIIDAPTLIANPTSNLMVFGQTTDVATYSNVFSTNNTLKLMLSNGIELNPDGTVNFAGNIGIINTTLPSVTEFYTGLATTSPVRVLALDAPFISGQAGTLTGGTEASIFHAYGNLTTGGGADIIWGAPNATVGATGGSVDFTNSPDTNPPATLAYGSKVIYDEVSGPGNVAADVNNVIFETQGLSHVTFGTAGADGGSTLQGKTISFASNYIEIVPTTPSLNLSFQNIYGNVQNVLFNTVGGVEVINSANSTNNASILSNTITTAGNTILGAGSLYGLGSIFELKAEDGYYSNSGTITPAPTNSSVIAGNQLIAAGNTLTGTGTGTSSLFGHFGNLHLHIDSYPTISQAYITQTGANGIIIGNGLIQNNIWNLGSNTLTGNTGLSNLYLGINVLRIENNELALPNGYSKPVLSEISGNQLNFSNSHSIATGGMTHFYDEIADLSQTNFYQYAVTAANVGGRVQVTDMAGTGAYNFADSTVHGNVLHLANDTMDGSQLATSTNVFHLNLLVTPTTTTTVGQTTTTNYGDIVGLGDTIINNFGSSANNILNLVLSNQLYNNILAQQNITPTANPTPITGAMLDSYMAATGGSVIHDAQNHITTIRFTDGETTPTSYGSIVLNGVDYTSLHNFGAKLHITADGLTTIDPPSSSSNIYNVIIPGDSLTSYTQNSSIINTDSLGHIVDFSGTVNLNLSSELFHALGLSDSNTAAQNVQILENNATTGLGGLAISAVTTGTGPEAVTNTILNIEALHNGVVTNYGSITLMHTTFTGVNPVENHLLVTHS